jgi:Tol biopolymer transport system component/DNA-binding winged helix-turn-helix (wHTH) protein
MSYTIGHFYRFHDFEVDVDQCVLLREGKPVPLRPKVFDTLLILVEHRGRIVGKDELMNRLWPDSFVEEDNLTFNIRQLRMALGDDARRPVYIETVARRGYRFIANMEEVLTEADTMQNPISVRARGSRLNGVSAFEASGTDQPGEVVSQPALTMSPAADETAVGWQAISSTSGVIAKTRKPLFAAVAVAAVVTLGAMVAVWYFRGSSNRNPIDGRAGNAITLPALNIEKLTATGKSRHAVISPDGEYVAYSSEVRGRESIWLRQLATGASREVIAFAEGRIYGMAFAHSGKHLYFVKGRPEPTALYRVPIPLGGVPTKLIVRTEGNFSLSPDDSQIALLRYSDDDRECSLVLADADGGKEHALAVHAQPDRFNTPAWSPDGQTIAVAAGPSDSGSHEVRILEVGVLDGKKREISTERWFHVSSLVWLPDKSGLLVAGEKVISETKQLWRISYPGGEASQLTNGLTSYVGLGITSDGGKAVATEMTLNADIWVGPAGDAQNLERITQATGGFNWMPDGRIVYSSSALVNRNLWAMKPDGTEQRQLTDSGENTNPVVTPDGRYIVFVSNRSGAFQIWRMNTDGSNKVELTRGGGGNGPAISPDGSWVIYHTVSDQRLWKVSIEGGDPVRLTEQYAVAPSISPDGRLIACVRKRDKKTLQLIIIPSDGGDPLHAFGIEPLRLSSYRLWWEPDGNGLRYAASHHGVTSLYRQSLKGGAPERLFDLNEDDIFDFAYSPDGQQLAATRGDWRFDVILIGNLKQ